MLSPQESLNAARPNDHLPKDDKSRISDKGAEATAAGETGGQNAQTGSPGCAGVNLVDRLVELNNSFARSILEVSKSYLQSIQKLQDNIMQANLGQSCPPAPAVPEEPADDASAELIRLNEISRLQLAWANRVSDTYMAEADRLVNLAHQTTQNLWSPVFPNGNLPGRDAASPRTE